MPEGSSSLLQAEQDNETMAKRMAMRLRAIMSEKRDGVEFLTKVSLDYYLTKSGLMVFGFCPAGSTCKVDLTFWERGVGLEYVS